jgi:hypothetical protein
LRDDHYRHRSIFHILRHRSSTSDSRRCIRETIPRKAFCSTLLSHLALAPKSQHRDFRKTASRVGLCKTEGVYYFLLCTRC